MAGMDTNPVKDLILKIKKFFNTKIEENLKSEKEIEKFRQNKAIEVTVHGNTAEIISIVGLEQKFLKRGVK